MRGRADRGADELALWAVPPGGHPLFDLLAETREDRTLTLGERQGREPQRYPLHGSLAEYRRFAAACGLRPRAGG